MKQLTQILTAGTLLAALSGAAMAQESNDDFKKPLSHSHAKSSQNSKSSMLMRQDDGTNSVELRVENGEYSAKVNGEAVPQDRIVREKDQVRILDKDGNTISTFQMSTDGGQTVIQGQPTPKTPKAPKAGRGSSAGGFGGAAGGGQGGQGGQGGGNSWSPITMQPALPANPPKVMLGIIMDSPGEELLKNYSLKEGEAILISRVIEGLPADKSGLKENDIITEIDGQKPVDQDKLREILKDKNPGDTVGFTVLRKGGDKSIRVTLGKYDPEKLGAAYTMPTDPAGGNDDDMHKLTEKAFKDAMRGGQWRTLTIPGDGRQGFVMGGGGADMEKKLAELDDKMADLDRKLQQVDDQMTKLQALIEKLSEQRQHK